MADLAGKKIAYYGFTGMIEPNNVTKIASALNVAVNNGCEEVYLCINSLGGYVGDGVFLYNHIRSLPLRVIAHNTGSLMSVAVAVFLGAEERYCSAHSVFMMHPTTLGPFQEALSWERLDSARSSALAEEARTENILRERTTIPEESLGARRLREVHISPQQALDWGLVQGVREFSLPQGNEIFQI